MGPIQRHPFGLLDALSIKGVSPPSNLGETVAPVLDLLQFYGLQQMQRRNAFNVALAEAASLTLTVPANEYWLLYDLGGSVVKTGTMTAFQCSVGYGPAGQNVGVLDFNGTPFGATETGTAIFGMPMPYPRLLLPTWEIVYRLNILGTDANANCSVAALVGVLA